MKEQASPFWISAYMEQRKLEFNQIVYFGISVCFYFR